MGMRDKAAAALDDIRFVVSTLDARSLIGSSELLAKAGETLRTEIQMEREHGEALERTLEIKDARIDQLEAQLGQYKTIHPRTSNYARRFWALRRDLSDALAQHERLIADDNYTHASLHASLLGAVEQVMLNNQPEDL